MVCASVNLRLRAVVYWPSVEKSAHYTLAKGLQHDKYFMVDSQVVSLLMGIMSTAVF